MPVTLAIYKLDDGVTKNIVYETFRTSIQMCFGQHRDQLRTVLAPCGGAFLLRALIGVHEKGPRV